MEKMKFHHIGIAAADLDETLQHLTRHLEVAEVSEPVYDKNQDGTLCMVTLKDGMNIELVSGEVVKGIVKKRRFLYHTCFLVKDLAQQVQNLIGEGYIQVTEAKEAVLFQNRKVCFLSGEFGMIELLEEEKKRTINRAVPTTR